MIRLTTPILMATLSLIMSAYTHTADAQVVAAQAAKRSSIPISYLPYTITAPGTYVLTGNLSYTGGGTNPAINITGVNGQIIIDLKGFTITSDVGTDYKACVYIVGGANAITMRNGSITMFEEGIYANGVSNVTVNKINFDQDVYGVFFEDVTTSLVNNCGFNSSNSGPRYGIYDYQTLGGNSYSNNSFVNCEDPLSIVAVPQNPTPLVLDHCQFAPPPSN
jgi:hypothetical protein